MTDLFPIWNDVDTASYADDNTPYVTDDDINGVIASLEKAPKILIDYQKVMLIDVFIRKS